MYPGGGCEGGGASDATWRTSGDSDDGDHGCGGDVNNIDNEMVKRTVTGMVVAVVMV